MDAKQNNNPAQGKSYVEEASCAMVYYAAERTLMSWTRVALGMMALGFVIDRFGLVLRMMPHTIGTSHHSTAYSFWTGTVLVLGGSAMAIVAAVRYSGLEKRFRREGCGAPDTDYPLASSSRYW